MPTWKEEVVKKLIGLYGKTHNYERASNPVEVLEASEIAHAFKELFPNLVDEG